MKTLAVLLAAVSMSGCVVHFPHGRDDADGRAHGARTVIVCIFASCVLPKKQETPTPAPSAVSESAPIREPRGWTPARGGGGSALYTDVGDFHAREVPEITR